MLHRLKQLLQHSPSRNWNAEDFSGIDQLHLGGVPATLELLSWLPIQDKDGSDLIGLDIGCGLGGTSRLLADMRSCKMVGLDLNPQYIEAAYH